MSVFFLFELVFFSFFYIFSVILYNKNYINFPNSLKLNMYENFILLFPTFNVGYKFSTLKSNAILYCLISIIFKIIYVLSGLKILRLIFSFILLCGVISTFFLLKDRKNIIKREESLSGIKHDEVYPVIKMTEVLFVFKIVTYIAYIF